jgi:hypothetical protein
MASEEEPTYKIKRVRWPPWADDENSAGMIPVLLQDVNGPCPLIAILNILLLRGRLPGFPEAVGEITQVYCIMFCVASPQPAEGGACACSRVGSVARLDRSAT